MLIDSHEIAEIFPEMIGEDFESLKEDIVKNGLVEPIVLFEGKILDGRNRYSACISEDIEPRFVEYEGDDPVGYVLSLNLFRRHLSAGQRAMVASNMADLPRGRYANSKSANLHIKKITQPEAASLLNVSERSVQTAKKIQENATPELAKKVESGEVTLNAAAKVAMLPVKEQKKIVEKGAKAVKQAAKEIKDDHEESDAQEYTKYDQLQDEYKALSDMYQELSDKVALGVCAEDDVESVEEMLKALRAENKELKQLYEYYKNANELLQENLNTAKKVIYGRDLTIKKLEKQLALK